MNLLERLAAEHLQLARPRVVLVTPSYDTSRYVVGLVFDGSRLTAVLKTCRQPGDDSGLRREAANLARLQQLGAGDDAPRPLALLAVGDCTGLLESALPGRPLGPERVRADRDLLVRTGTALVERLPVTGTHPSTWYDDLVAAPVEALRTAFPGLVDDLVGPTHDALATLRDARLPAVFEHGDLSHPNLLLAAPERLSAVDWERSVEYGVPGHDLTYLLAYAAEAQAGAATLPERMAAIAAALVDDAGWARPVLAAHLSRRGVDPTLMDALLLATAARGAARLAAGLVGTRTPDDEERLALARRDRDVVLWRLLLDRWSPVADLASA